jgi:hypothetical protein
MLIFPVTSQDNLPRLSFYTLSWFRHWSTNYTGLHFHASGTDLQATLDSAILYIVPFLSVWNVLKLMVVYWKLYFVKRQAKISVFLRFSFIQIVKFSTDIKSRRFAFSLSLGFRSENSYQSVKGHYKASLTILLPKYLFNLQSTLNRRFVDV